VKIEMNNFVGIILQNKFFPCCYILLAGTRPKPGLHSLFVIVGRITFIFVNYGRQSVQDIFIFCISSVLLQHTEPSPLPHVCLAVFLQSTVPSYSKTSFD